MEIADNIAAEKPIAFTKSMMPHLSLLRNVYLFVRNRLIQINRDAIVLLMTGVFHVTGIPSYFLFPVFQPPFLYLVKGLYYR
jgi:hypothetical protein